MKIKKLFATTTIAFLLCVSSVFALGMTAGPVMIVTDVGSTNSSYFGLINNGNETITVKIRAEGDAAQFLEIPATLELVPKKLTNVDVKATIPSAYDGSLGGNITGFIYAVQEGAPGQVQINIQAQKTVQILIPKYGGKLPEPKTPTQTPVQTTTGENRITGFTSLVSNPLLPFSIGAVVLVFFVFVISRRFDISIKPKEVKK